MLMYVSSCNSPTKCGQWVADGKVGDGVSVRADGWCDQCRHWTDSMVRVSRLTLNCTRYHHRRTSGDIQATWGSIMSNLDGNNAMAPVNHKHPGHYNGNGKARPPSLKL